MASSSTIITTSSSTSSKSLLPSEPLPWRTNTRPKLPPGALLDIDQGPLWDIITEWLPFESVCHLDSALCNKTRRPEFLQLLATRVLLFNREEIKILKDPYRAYALTHRALGAAALNWVLKRGIHLASLHLPLIREINPPEMQSIRDTVALLLLNGRFDKLETICLLCCSYIYDADLASILSKCYSSVKSINIKYCGHTESAAMHIKRCTKLEAFTAKGNESVADMVEIFQACRKLRKLDLSMFMDRLTDDVVLSVADHCHVLEHFDVTRCKEVSDAVIRRVAESCPLLQYVDLTYVNITDTTVVALCNSCPLLKRLFVIASHNLTDTAVLAVAERLPGLTHIDLSVITAITSSAVETLASKCRALESIRLTNCLNVSDATLMKIAEHCSKLEYLDVEECPNVTAVGVAEIRLKCLKLRTFDFDYEYDGEDQEEEEDVEED